MSEVVVFGEGCYAESIIFQVHGGICFVQFCRYERSLFNVRSEVDYLCDTLEVYGR